MIAVVAIIVTTLVWPPKLKTAVFTKRWVCLNSLLVYMQIQKFTILEKKMLVLSEHSCKSIDSGCNVACILWKKLQLQGNIGPSAFSVGVKQI